MKVLFIGGTGNISTSVSRLCVKSGCELYLLNRGLREIEIEGAKSLVADISDDKNVSSVLADEQWDVVVNWIAFTKDDILRDARLFSGKTKQYIFISSASAYQKPLSHPVVTESTPLANPYWQYSRNKIECENELMRLYRDENFPVTIVRPSLTYDTVIPVAIGGWTEFTIVDRILNGKKIIVHGDGTSLWTITHAEDFAKGFIGLMGHQQAIGQAFHITSDEILTWDQIYQAVAEAVNMKPRIIHIPSDFIAKYKDDFVGSLIGDKAVSVIFDNSKIKRYVPGYIATIPFNAGIKRTIKWFQSKNERMIVRQETNDLMDRIISDYERPFVQ